MHDDSLLVAIAVPAAVASLQPLPFLWQQQFNSFLIYADEQFIILKRQVHSMTFSFNHRRKFQLLATTEHYIRTLAMWK